MLRLAAFCLLVAAAFPASADRVLVFAAASLKEALDANVRAFEAASGHAVVVSYAGSNALAKQIENGAPAELFISADTDWVDHLVLKGLSSPDRRRDILRNDLVLIAPAGSAVSVKLVRGVNLAPALGNKRFAIASPEAVPAGKYARAALSALGAWPSVEARLAPADNVRAALALVSRGEAPLGVVYRTDALAEKGVRIVDTFPPDSHPPIVYPMLTLRKASPAAGAFAAYLAGPQARATFERFGFRAH